MKKKTLHISTMKEYYILFYFFWQIKSNFWGNVSTGRFRNKWNFGVFFTNLIQVYNYLLYPVFILDHDLVININYPIQIKLNNRKVVHDVTRTHNDRYHTYIMSWLTIDITQTCYNILVFSLRGHLLSVIYLWGKKLILSAIQVHVNSHVYV